MPDISTHTSEYKYRLIFRFYHEVHENHEVNNFKDVSSVFVSFVVDLRFKQSTQAADCYDVSVCKASGNSQLSADFRVST
jgi:hypothetical protein